MPANDKLALSLNNQERARLHAARQDYRAGRLELQRARERGDRSAAAKLIPRMAQLRRDVQQIVAGRP